MTILLRLVAGQCILHLSCLQSTINAFTKWPYYCQYDNDQCHVTIIAAMYWKNCSSLNGQFHVSSSHLRSPQICYSTIQCVVCHYLPPFVILTKWFLLFLCFMDIKSHHQENSRSLGDTYNTLQLWLGLIIPIFCSFWSWNNNFANLWSDVLCHNYQKPCRMFQNDSKTLHCPPHSDMGKFRLVSYQNMWPRWESAKIFVCFTFYA